jgi:Holliday junction resolvase RusA-like endonuclease
MVDIHLDIYVPTPVSSMSKIEIVLAQMKKIRPIGNGDWDNLAKTYCDMMQDILIYNDNIIATGSVDKYYSIKPKVVVSLKYQSDFDCNYNRRKVTGSKSYKKLMEI